MYAQPKILAKALALALTATLAISACSSSKSGAGGGGSSGRSGGTFTIPVINTLTGTGAEFGQSDSVAIKMAVDKINASGGIDGTKLAVDIKDDGGQASQAATIMRSLTASNAIVAVGPLQSETVGAAWPLAKRGQLPVVGTTQSTKVVAATQPWGFDGIITSAPMEKAGVQKWTAAVPDVKTVVLLVDQQNAGSALVGTLLAGDLKDASVRVVKTINYNEGQASYASEASQVKAANADGVVLAGYSANAGVVLKAIRAAGVNSPVLLGTPAMTSDMLKSAGPAAGNCWANVVFWPTAATSEQQPWVDAYNKASNGVALQQPAPYLYDDIFLIANALKSSGVLTMKGSTQDKREALRKALGTTSFTGVTGPFKINSDGYLDGHGTFLQILADGTVKALSS